LSTKSREHIAVLVWEMMRLRRYKAMLIEEALPKVFRDFVERYFGDAHVS
jgi:hypothetical protein